MKNLSSTYAEFITTLTYEDINSKIREQRMFYTRRKDLVGWFGGVRGKGEIPYVGNTGSTGAQIIPKITI